MSHSFTDSHLNYYKLITKLVTNKETNCHLWDSEAMGLAYDWFILCKKSLVMNWGYSKESPASTVFHKIPRQHRNSVETGKFYGSVVHRKLWSLIINVEIGFSRSWDLSESHHRLHVIVIIGFYTHHHHPSIIEGLWRGLNNMHYFPDHVSNVSDFFLSKKFLFMRCPNAGLIFHSIFGAHLQGHEELSK